MRLGLVGDFFFFFAGSRFLSGLLALPLCGAAVTFFAAAKKVTKESSSLRPAVTRNLGSSLVADGTRLKSALKHLIGLGSRTVRRPKTLRTLVQHETASAQRYALPLGMHRKPTQTRTETNGAFTTANILFSPHWTTKYF